MEQVVTVSQINRYIKLKMDHDSKISDIYVSGEISNFVCHSKSGHFYFSLKDEESSIKAVMFKQNSFKVKFTPQNGQKVIVRGQISVFERDGIYQIYVTEMIPDGAGNLALAFEQLKEKLRNEGLFEEENKKAIPKYPEKIGIITSPTGAALQDMLNVFSRRYPLCELYVYPAVVQGDNAAKTVIDGLKYFDANAVDAIIIARGGGSAEDLWCFNDEALARAIFASKTPVVSGVGHETDFTITDFVSDLRAPTPSAAAELCAPDVNSLRYNISKLYEKCEILVNKKVAFYLEKVSALENRPCLKNAEFYLQSMREKLNSLANRPCLKNLDGVFSKHKEKIYSLYNTLCLTQQKSDIKRNGQLSSLCAKLDALSPLKVLSRGYATVTKNGATACFNDLNVNDEINVRFFDGNVNAKIISKNERE